MTPQERTQAIKRLEKILGCKVPLDGILTATFQMPVIDIVALDQKLIRRYEYGGSMESFIRQRFGDEANQILDAL